MKILIMVLSYNEHPFDELMKAQIDTWESVHTKDVGTVFYHGGNKEQKWTAYPNNGFPDKVSYRLSVDATDSYYYMAEKFKEALDFVKGWEYDFVFRTNSSSYVNKQKLVEFASRFPSTGVYAGWTMKDTNHDGGDCVSGAGILLSRDCVEILRKEINPEVEMEEDVYLGRILRANGIVATDDQSRFDYKSGHHIDKSFSRYYHIRFKTANRLQDAANMRKVHKAII